MPRNVVAQAKLLGEDRIALGPLDHVQEAETREARALVAGDRIDDLLIATHHQHVGYDGVERFALGDREQMRLALGFGIGDEDVAVEPLGMRQHRSCDLDRIVEGEFVDDVGRRTTELGHAAGELRARSKLDLLRQAPDHLAEGADLVLAIAAGDQKIGRIPQRSLAAFSRSPRDRVIKIA